MRILSLPALALAVLLPAIASAQSAAPSASPVALPSEDPAITARAKDLLHQAQTGQFDRTQLDGKMNAALTDAIAKNLASQLSPLGPPTGFKLAQITSDGTYKVYVYVVAFKDGPLAMQIAIDPATGKIGGLWFKPIPGQ
ncbi:MAG: hypothetical protein JO029_11200 [Candidatus Eremiobacteraeota bacterium]|nr:hypothetical protein [Candidatus Eremiobacteraeota bacterium]MBV8722473.1 hypothetical protein [Candidatus Eremiobacteraeota bacterium]